MPSERSAQQFCSVTSAEKKNIFLPSLWTYNTTYEHDLEGQGEPSRQISRPEVISLDSYRGNTHAAVHGPV